MSILINKNTRVIIQGITGHQGSFQTKTMLDYGTKIVAGVTPGKEGENVEEVPIYNSVSRALRNHKADYSVMFVPAQFAKNAAFEALNNNLNLVMITENIPVHDIIDILDLAKRKKKIVIGPNCPGLTSVGESKVGIMSNHIFKKGNVGIVSRSGTLTYEITNQLSRKGVGQSTVVGIGGAKIVGSNFIDIIKEFEKDDNTKKIVMIGEIGGNLEEKAAEYIKNKCKKDIIAYIVGKTAPKGKRMGHAGAIISGDTGTYESKHEALKKAGVKVVNLPSQIIKFTKS